MITLALDSVGVRYGARTVLENITVPAMRGGEVVAVIGPNGAGKSTLLRRIAGLVAGPGQVQMETGTSRPARACYLPQDTAFALRTSAVAANIGPSDRIGNALDGARIAVVVPLFLALGLWRSQRTDA